MQKPKNARAKRVRNLVAICSLIAIILSASTYAWFIGMRTVNVSSFDVEIAATDSLLLSLDGETWDTTVAISQADLDTVSYANHTNSWGGAGLKPMSSIGEMDVDASRMKLFEKASLTATPGGYRLMASQVHNYDNPTEQDGYVAFDLFVRNFTGTQYIPEYNELDEEAIYLTAGPDGSKVTVAMDGGVENTGIENSVRVAFAQIGRVSGDTTDPTTITSIECTPFAGEVGEEKPTVVGELTGICRTAQIWEPNDTAHVNNAISWYNTSCRERTGEFVTEPGSFTANDCIALTDTVAYPTYAVKEPISSSNNVDIYDGAAYNKYVASSQLYAYDTFTDTERDDEGTARTPFMTLAPNSITKIRVYIYIEGQDVDNYDFASIGKKISVQFGFTKERFNEGDIHYNENLGPTLNPGTDTSKPEITLDGESEMTLELGTPYKEPGTGLGYTAIDPDDGEGHTNVDITRWVKVINPVNHNEPGVYYITYNVSDWQGNYAAQVVRKVTVTDTP